MSAHTRRYRRSLTGRVEGLLIIGCSLPTSSVANVEVTLGIAGIDLRKIFRSMSLQAFSSGWLLALPSSGGFDVHLRSLEGMTGGQMPFQYRSSLGHLHTGGISLSRDPKPPSCQQSRDRPLTNSGCSVASINCETSASTVARYLAGPSLISFDNYHQLLLYRLSTYLLDSILERSRVPMIFGNDIHEQRSDLPRSSRREEQLSQRFGRQCLDYQHCCLREERLTLTPSSESFIAPIIRQQISVRIALSATVEKMPLKSLMTRFLTPTPESWSSARSPYGVHSPRHDRLYACSTPSQG